MLRLTKNNAAAEICFRADGWLEIYYRIGDRLSLVDQIELVPKEKLMEKANAK